MRRGVVSVVGLVIGVAVVVALVAVVVVALVRPIPPVTLQRLPVPKVVPGRLTALTWPAAGQAALGVDGIGMIASRGAEKPAPIASVAKVMTAFVVLRDHPLRAGEDGPQLTVTPSDVEIYKADIATDQSTAKVKAGETLSERQALEALLLPSANNVATLLAEWDAGSEAAFVAKMNSTAHELGLAHTHYVDASGFDPETVSTARDQVRLAMRAFRIPALAQIAGTPSVVLPVAGKLENLDALLGSGGMIGGKTGSTSQAGGCFVFAARRTVGRRHLVVVGAVLGQPATATEPSILDAAFDSSRRLLKSVSRVLEPLTAIDRGRVVGHLTAPWAIPVLVRLRRVPPLVVWPGMRLHVRIVAPRQREAPVQAGQRVGTVVFRAPGQRGRGYLVAMGDVPSPSVTWRLTHP